MGTSGRLVIVGAGAAGLGAAEGARHAGHRGEIVVIDIADHEPTLPRDLLGAGPAVQGGAPLRWFDEHRVDLVLGTTVTRVDPLARTVRTGYGDDLGFGHLLLATGRTCARTKVAATVSPTTEAVSVTHTVAPGGTLLVVGTGPTAVAAASAAAARGIRTTLLSPGGPFHGLLPSDMANWVARHQLAGVEVVDDADPASVHAAGADAFVATSTDGRQWRADAVLGDRDTAPHDGLLRAAGAHCDAHGVVVTDSGATSLPQIYAAGDVASQSLPFRSGRFHNTGRRSASAHGYAVGAAAVGRPAAAPSMPQWSTRIGGHRLEVAGWPAFETHAALVGSLERRDFIRYSFVGDHVIGVLGIGRWRALAMARDLVRSQRAVDVDALTRAAAKVPA